jgi:hypothetical protein
MLLCNEMALRATRRGWRAFWVVAEADRSGILEALQAAPSTASAIAGTLSLDPRVTHALLRHLAACGLLVRSGDRFALRDAGEDVIRAYREMAHEFRQMPLLAGTLRTGAPVHRTRSGVSIEDEADRSAFLRGLARRSGPSLATATAFVVNECRMRGAERPSILDLGGGHGAFAGAFAAAMPEARVVLFDQREVIALADPSIAHRVEARPGDFHVDELGGPYDVVFISNVITCEQDGAAVTLLRRVLGELVPGGVAIVRDRMLHDDEEGPVYASDFALTLAMGTDAGVIRSFAELRSLLLVAGFEDVRFEELAAEEYAYALARRGVLEPA